MERGILAAHYVWLVDPDGRLAQLQQAGWSNQRIVNEFYVLALGRNSRWNELPFWIEQFAAAEPADQSAVLEDFVWALLNSREFLTNH